MSRQKERFNVRTACPELAEGFERCSVLLVVSSYLPNLGGLQSVTSQLARELQWRGHRVEVLAQRYPRSLPAAEVIDGICVRRLLFLTLRLRDLAKGRLDLFLASQFYFPVTLLRLLWCIARDKPQVVNLHFVGAPALFLLIARTLLRFRFVVSLHGDDVEGLPRGAWFDRWVFRATLRRADAVTACSRYLLDQAEKIEPSIAPKAHVVYNGTDLSPIPFPLEEGKQGDRLLAVGRLMPKKGFDVLLRAFAQRDSATRRLDLVLIGDGPERAALESLKQELCLDGTVTLRGAENRDAVARAMAESDVVVIPSRQEPFGMVALEAMASGKPVIAMRVGGLPEVLDGADAVMVAPEDPSALAQAIDQTLSRLEREPDYGARNREIAARFSAARMVDQYETLYACGKPATV